ncbi:transporter [Polaromonas sp.]|uniref:transporter n=1 Tax=Polaromonas sp. TaxID=1869339 RepID=UPI00345A8EED
MFRPDFRRHSELQPHSLAQPVRGCWDAITRERGGRASVILDAGLGYLLAPNVQLDFSVGKGVRGNTSPRAFVSAGISTRF